MHHTVPASGDLGLLFLASLMGGAHCAGMCGPYVAICAARIVPPTASGAVRNVLRLLFNFGRLATYVALGTVAGAFGEIAGAAGTARRVPGAISLVAGVFAIAFSLSLAGVFPSAERAAASLGLDRWIRAAAREAFRVPPYRSALLLGSLQGLLPCALVYGAASRAAAAGSAGKGALTMFVFGLGTLPALLTLTMSGRALPSWIRSRIGSAVFVGLLGVLLSLRGLAGWGLVPHTRFW